MTRHQATARPINHATATQERRRVDSGVRLSLALQRHDVTVRHLAACTGVSESKVKRIQEGKHTLPLDLVSRAPRPVARELLEQAAERAGLGIHETIDSNEDCVSAVENILSMDRTLVRQLLALSLRREITPEEARDLHPMMRTLAANAQALMRLCERATKEGRAVQLDEEKPR